MSEATAESPGIFGDLARQADVIASWHTGDKGRVCRELADKLWEKAGGRQPLPAGNPHAATPGPGVRAETAAPGEPVVVDSVGEIDDKSDPVEPVVPETPAVPATPAARPHKTAAVKPDAD